MKVSFISLNRNCKRCHHQRIKRSIVLEVNYNRLQFSSECDYNDKIKLEHRKHSTYFPHPDTHTRIIIVVTSLRTDRILDAALLIFQR